MERSKVLSHSKAARWGVKFNDEGEGTQALVVEPEDENCANDDANSEGEEEEEGKNAVMREERDETAEGTRLSSSEVAVAMDVPVVKVATAAADFCGSASTGAACCVSSCRAAEGGEGEVDVAVTPCMIDGEARYGGIVRALAALERRTEFGNIPQVLAAILGLAGVADDNRKFTASSEDTGCVDSEV